MLKTDFKNKYIDTKPIFYHEHNVSVTIRQLAAYESITGGNKWYKLKFNFQKAKDLGLNKIVTFGGAYSNHIAATAKAGKLLGFNTIGIIRGEENASNNITLSRATADGMKLIFISREDYKRKNDSSLLTELLSDESQYYLIPEGGSNHEGVMGCKEIICEKDAEYSDVVVSCGTGTTAAGIILSMQQHQKLTGISVLKDGGTIEQAVNMWLEKDGLSNPLPQWEINHNFHFGGYAKKSDELIKFCENFSKQHQVLIEPVYTGKLFFALEQLIRNNYFDKGSNILAVHTGGLQYLIK